MLCSLTAFITAVCVSMGSLELLGFSKNWPKDAGGMNLFKVIFTRWSWQLLVLQTNSGISPWPASLHPHLISFLSTNILTWTTITSTVLCFRCCIDQVFSLLMFIHKKIFMNRTFLVTYIVLENPTSIYITENYCLKCKAGQNLVSGD